MDVGGLEKIYKSGPYLLELHAIYRHYHTMLKIKLERIKYLKLYLKKQRTYS